MAEHHGEGDIWAIGSGAVFGIIMQIQAASSSEFIFRAVIGGMLGAAAAWLTKRILDFIVSPGYKWLKNKFKKTGYPTKYKRKK